MIRRRLGEQSRIKDDGAPLFVLLGALLLFFLRFGYDYGTSDQDEVIPYLLHRLDRGLFTQDWFVQLQVSEFSVRTYFVWLLNVFALILPVWLSVLIVYVGSWLAIASAIYRLTFHFTRDQLAACAAVVLVLVFTPVWTLGGNELVHSMLVASMAAWAIGLWAIYQFVRGRYLIAPVMLGITCWIQALVGLHLAVLLFLVRVWMLLRREPGADTVSGAVVFGALFALWSSPAIGPIVYQQFFSRPVNPDPSLFYIIAEFRLPHHYLPFSFYMQSALRFGIVGLLGGAALTSKMFRRTLTDHQFIVRTLLLIAFFCVVALIFTEFVPVLLVAKLQFFKMTVLAKVLLLMVICGFVFYWMPEGIRRILMGAVRHARWSLAAIVLLWAMVLFLTLPNNGILHDKVGPFQRSDEPIGQIETWAKRHSRLDAIYAIPPSWSSFRSEAQRTIVVNFKAVPYEDEHMLEWFTRLRDLAPAPLPDRGGASVIDDLDQAYERLSAGALVRLSEKYRFDYVIRETPLVDPQFREVFTAGSWRIYQRSRPVPGPEDADQDLAQQ